MRGWTSMLAAAWLVMSAASVTAGTVSHSGTVVALDRDAGTLVIDEIGPWIAGKGKPEVTRHVVTVTAHTIFVAAARSSAAGAGGWSGGFVEQPLEPWELRVGDFVTVLCAHDGRFVTALEIVVAVQGAR